jgi:hypothetical protein
VTDPDQKLTDVEIRLHALNLAAAQRREVFHVGKDDGQPGWLARETLFDAQLYAGWIANGGEVAMPSAPDAAAVTE